MLSWFDDSISRLQRFLDLTLTLTWGVAPGYYISRRWRWFVDFCSKADAHDGFFLRILLILSNNFLLQNSQHRQFHLDNQAALQSVARADAAVVHTHRAFGDGQTQP